MTPRKFTVGDRVTYISGSFDGNVRPGLYTIAGVLPLTSAGYQYRVKSTLDVHERVIDEVQLRSG